MQIERYKHLKINLSDKDRKDLSRIATIAVINVVTGRSNKTIQNKRGA